MDVGGVVAQENGFRDVYPHCSVITRDALMKASVAASELAMGEIGPDAVNGNGMGVGDVGGWGRTSWGMG